MPKFTKSPRVWITTIILLLIVVGVSVGQQNQSGGAPSTVTANQGGTWSMRLQDGSGNTISSTSGALNVNISSGGLSAGSNIIGIVRDIPGSCTQTTVTTVETIGVASGAGTSVSSTTGCIIACYVNNTTNSPVTIRLADKSGTPNVWLGGNADFTIPSNSNLNCGNGGLAGVVFTSGITAIASTGSALNLNLSWVQ